MSEQALAPIVHRVTALHQAYVELLSRFEWHWFCTFTFDPKKHSSPNGFIHPEKAFKAVMLFIHKLNSAIYGKNWKRRGDGVHWAIALEYHKSGILHLHALIGDVRNLNEIASRVGWKEWWYREFGIARIEEPKDAGGVQGYCTKYVVKGGEIELSSNLVNRASQLGLGLRGGRTKKL